jgi:hypothetical protein
MQVFKYSFNTSSLSLDVMRIGSKTILSETTQFGISVAGLSENHAIQPVVNKFLVVWTEREGDQGIAQARGVEILTNSCTNMFIFGLLILIILLLLFLSGE